MKNALTTGALVGAILMGQYEAKGQTTELPPQPKVVGLDDCIEIAGLCVIFSAGWACWANGWRRIWSGGTNDTVMTGAPLPRPWEPIDGPGGGLDSVGKPKLRMNGAYAYALTNAAWTNMVVFIEQATANLVDWTNRFAFSVWESPTARLMLVSSPEGVPLWTNLAPRGVDGRSTNYCPILDMPKDKGHEYFRLLSQ